MDSNNHSQLFVYLREKAGVTQKEIANALGITDHTVRNWEKGRAKPLLQLWQLLTLCELLKCSIDELPDFFTVEMHLTQIKPILKTLSSEEISALCKSPSNDRDSLPRKS